MTREKKLDRWPVVTLSVVLGMSTLVPTVFTQQTGGAYRMQPSVVTGGGGSSANGARQIEGSVGQSVVSGSIEAPYAVQSGFWPNAASCPAALSPLSEFFVLSGGSGSVNVIAPSFCSWTATVSESWLTLTSKDSGTGNGVVTFETVENFTGSARKAVINVSGFAHLVVQDAGLGDDCGYFISPAYQSFPASGGGGTISVTAAERCAWQAATSVGWVTLTSVSVGIGNGTVSYSVAPNPSATGRKGTILTSGQAFAVKQKGQ